MMLINSYSFAQVDTYKVSITVPDASIASTLTGFPVYVDLSGMPSGFWTHLASDDGGDIRVTDGSGNPIPFDLVAIDPTLQTGALWFKRTLTNGGSTVSYITYGDSDLSLLAVNDTYGRNNTWSDYHRVFTFSETNVDRTGAGTEARRADTTEPETFDLFSTSADLGVHQGIAWDGTHYYAFHTDRIKKYDSSFSLVATNSNVLTEVGSVDHLGDGFVLNGVIHACVENYPAVTNMRIGRWNASDLSFIDSVSVSAQGHEVSSCCYSPTDDLIYVTSYLDGTKLWKYNSSTLAYVGSTTLSETISMLQGITWWRGAFWTNQDSSNRTRRIEFDGTVRATVFGASGGSYEGLDHNDSGLLVLHDTTGSAAGVVKQIRPKPVLLGASFSGNVDKCLRADGLTKLTSWTMGASAKLAATNDGANKSVLSYTDDGGVTDNALRGTLAFRNASNAFGVWNTVDTWQEAAVTPDTSTTYRLHYTHDGTTSRSIYVNGGNVSTDTGCAQRPAGTDPSSLYIGMEDESLTEDMNGSIGFVYVRNGILSADWIAAEYSNLNAPGIFYTVGSEEVV